VAERKPVIVSFKMTDKGKGGRIKEGDFHVSRILETSKWRDSACRLA
jgi:hypothetical protein